MVGLGWMVSEGPFQSLSFCDSVGDKAQGTMDTPGVGFEEGVEGAFHAVGDAGVGLWGSAQT